MDGNIVVRATQNAQTSSNVKILKDGDTAHVRVIADKGNGRYEGSVSGVRVSFSSAKPLSVGSSFTAAVSTKGNTIILSPLLSDGAHVINQTENILTLNEPMTASLLQSLGLENDALSYNLLQMSKQMEMKVEPDLIAKVRSMAMRSGGKAKAVAEMLMLLAEKGLDAEMDDVLAMLGLLEGELKNQFDEAEKGKQLLNKVNSEKGSWFLLPFELVSLANEDVLGRGNIRMLFDKAERLKLLNVFCDYDVRKYYFSMEYAGGKVKNVYFNVDDLDEDALLEYKNFLQNSFSEKNAVSDDNNVRVCVRQRAEIEGSACGLEKFYSFGGVV